MKKLLTALFLLPLFLCADLNQKFSEAFSEKMSVYDAPGCYEVLDIWGKNVPTMSSTIQGLRASVALMEGNLQESAVLMEQALIELEGFSLSSEAVRYIVLPPERHLLNCSFL